jgi:hypothetical protein
MSEFLHEAAEPAQELVAEDIVEPETTGDAAVDAVVASLRGLDGLPASEHVAVFERAHESLRQVLSGAGEPAPATQS